MAKVLLTLPPEVHKMLRVHSVQTGQTMSEAVSALIRTGCSGPWTQAPAEPAKARAVHSPASAAASKAMLATPPATAFRPAPKPGTKR